ncbi:MAG TPA: hypothetical protein VIU61_16910 [Kofleriaceae bacterium]
MRSFVVLVMSAVCSLASAQPVDPPAVDAPAVDPPAVDPPAVDPPAEDRRVVLVGQIKIAVDAGLCESAVELSKRLTLIDPHYSIEATGIRACLVRLARPAAVAAAVKRNQEPVKERSYGYQIFILDALGVGATLLTFGAAFPSLVATGPLIHNMHGYRSRAYRSFALRAGPILVGYAGSYVYRAASGCDEGYYGSGCTNVDTGIFIAGLVIVVGGMASDWGAKKTVACGPSWTPTVNASGRDASLGIAGYW